MSSINPKSFDRIPGREPDREDVYSKRVKRNGEITEEILGANTIVNAVASKTFSSLPSEVDEKNHSTQTNPESFVPIPDLKDVYFKKVERNGEIIEEILEATIAVDTIYRAIFVRGEIISSEMETRYGFNKGYISKYPFPLQEYNSKKNELYRLPSIYGSELPPENRDNTLENFEADTVSRQLLKETAEKILNNEISKKVIYVCGRPGCGKTHVATALARQLVKNGASVFFGGQGFSAEPGLLHKYPFCKYIFIDDLPLPPQNEYYSVEKNPNLEKILSWYRFAISSDRILWITSNQTEFQDLNKLKRLLSGHNLGCNELEDDFLSLYVEGTAKRKGLADMCNEPSFTMEDVFLNPGSPPGVIVFKNVNECQDILNKAGKPSYQVTSKDDVGILNRIAENILVMSDSNDILQKMKFMRAAWEKGKLIILISKETDKKMIISSVLEVSKNSRAMHQGKTSEKFEAMHQGKEEGNESRLNAMMIMYSELKKRRLSS